MDLKPKVATGRLHVRSYNRRFYRHASFETILGLALHHEPAGYWEIIGRANPR
jgi:hypothetical protein